MLVDDLRTTAPDQLNCEVVERSDLTLEPDPVGQKDCHLNSVVAKMRQEQVLEAWCGCCGQCPIPDGTLLDQSRPSLSKKSDHATHYGSCFRHETTRSSPEYGTPLSRVSSFVHPERDKPSVSSRTRPAILPCLIATLRQVKVVGVEIGKALQPLDIRNGDRMPFQRDQTL
jgi:hypothetical protein